MQSKNTAYLQRLDHLRALAVLFVTVFEFKQVSGFTRLPEKLYIPMFERGQVGVTLFMVISAFILTHIAYGHQIAAKRFYLNRVLRIYPLFVIVVALGYLAPPTNLPPTQAILDFFLALLPISNFYRLHYGAYGGVFWSIAVELQFYLLFPLIWRMLAANAVRFTAALIALFIAIRAGAYVTTGAAYDFGYFTLFGSMDAFLFGSLCQLAYAHFGARTISPGWSAGLLLIIAALTYGQIRTDPASPLWIIWPTILSAAFAAFVLSYLLSRRAIPFGPVFAFVGRVSFSIYAWQYVVFAAAAPVLPYLRGVGVYQAGLIVFALGIFPLAIASYQLIEKPFLDLRVRYLRSPSHD